MLLAGNTGHDGAITTLHANGVRDLPARVEALAMLAGVDRFAAHSLLASAVQAAVHLRRAADGFRHLAEIALLARGDDGLVRAQTAVSCSARVRSAHKGPGAGELARMLEERNGSVPRLLAAP
jgi:pilus assembly protein CpaF